MSDPKKLTQTQIDSAKEVVIPVTLRGLAEGWRKITYKAPVRLYKRITRKVDDVAISKPMRNGFLAALTMPVSIMARNGSRAAHNLADGHYKHTAHALGGVAAAGASWWVAGSAA